MEWLHQIAPHHFTRVMLNRIKGRETLVAYLYLLTGLTEGDKLPASLGHTWF